MSPALFLYDFWQVTETIQSRYSTPVRGGCVPQKPNESLADPLFSRWARPRATIRSAADAGTRRARRSEPNRADAWPVSHGTSAPPKEALAKTQPLFRQASR